ncbi:MAG: hypothetical protein IT237_06605 [Bacteroidia bacterium]|nr:hypothetical protein [Bacteroidia bacterium]
MRKQKIIKWGVISLAIFIFIELALRYFYGFCDAVLIREDSDYEYIAIKNQKRKRFGKTIMYNSLSMRSNELNPQSIKVLGFGDSFINGGTLTEQDSLATSILSDSLSKLYKKDIQFLNISAGSWGPDNCFAYLKKHGDFQSKYFILFVSSHDAYDNMNFEKIVGVNKSFPSKQYSLAIYELIDRYLLPKISKNNQHYHTDHLGINKKQIGSVFNTGFESFYQYTKLHNIELVIYLHADKNELKLKQYNEQGKEIIKFCTDRQIPLIKDLDYHIQENEYRDNIHVNQLGQKKLSIILLNYIINKNLLHE